MRERGIEGGVSSARSESIEGNAKSVVLGKL